MAAAEYYNPGGGNMPQAPPVQSPRPQQQYLHPQQSNGNLPYPVSDAPPPYSAFGDQTRPHSQPPPQTRPQHHVNFAPTNNYGPAETHAYPPEKTNYRPSAMANVVNAQPPPPGQYGPSQQPYRPPIQQGYPNPSGLAPPPTQPGRRASGGSGYRPAVKPYQDDYDYDDYDSRSQSRDRGSSGRHHHHHNHDQKKKGKNSVSTFLGAGGGALIGDLIFPGLGTIGGAVLGGVGGHEYGKQRRSYSNDARSKSYHGSSRDYDYDDGMDRRGRRKNDY